MKRFRVEFNRNQGYQNEVYYCYAYGANNAYYSCQHEFGHDITILEVCEVLYSHGKWAGNVEIPEEERM